ncbi:hypothetical protein IM40_11405 (plasmid) [Candidatus Paracaedimonas acanthamoebae]|nr:hypothetical protein IM40_11405 [Candidatus Paracaedimonas acanthamoebae]
MNYEKAARKGHKLACLNLAHLLKQHPELFSGSQEERMQEIDHLRDRGKEMYNQWSQGRSFKP